MVIVMIKIVNYRHDICPKYYAARKFQDRDHYHHLYKIKRHNKIKRHKRIKGTSSTSSRKDWSRPPSKPGLHFTYKHYFTKSLIIFKFLHFLTIYPQLQNIYGQKLPLCFVHFSYIAFTFTSKSLM